MQTIIDEAFRDPMYVETAAVIAFIAVLITVRRVIGAGRHRRSS